MTTAITLPEGAPEEVITHAKVRDVDLTPFGYKGVLALITLDNGLDHTRPNRHWYLNARCICKVGSGIY